MIRSIFCNNYLILIMVLTSCTTDTLLNSDLPEWDGWQKPPSEISINVETLRPVSKSDSMNYQIVLTNESDNRLRINGGRPMINNVEFDLELVAVNSNNRIVWSRIPLDTVSPLVLVGIDLEPGERFTTTGSWNFIDSNGQPIPPGNYTLFGGLTLNNVVLLDGEKIIKEMEFSWPPIRSKPFEIQIEQM